MKAIVQDLVEAGELVTERELMNELRSVAEGANDLDQENFAATSIPGNQKLALGAATRVMVDDIETVQTVTAIYVASSFPLVSIPDAAGTQWVKTFTSRGGMLLFTLRAAFERIDASLPDSPYFWVGLLVDGELVGRSPDQQPQSPGDTLMFKAPVFIGPGTHVVEPIFGTSFPDVDVAQPASLTISFLDRSLTIVEHLQ